MATEKPATLQIETFADHHVITQPNPLRKVLRRVAEKDHDDPIARAEYLLKLEGFDIGEQTTKDVPPELLEEVFELNMALEEADVEQLESARQRSGGGHPCDFPTG